MLDTITTGGIHHLRLTVSDVNRARDFYTDVLGFAVVADLNPGYFLTNGNFGLGLGPHPNPATALPNDRFDENRVGLDHLSLSVDSRDDLERAALILDEKGVPRGEIEDLGAASGLYVMAFRDPDNVQLELSAPYA
jgi:glyoxylase I family protein